MDIKDFNEALYASSNGVVVERRKSIIVPMLVLLVGVALLVANYFIENGNDANNLKSALVLTGGCVAIIGAVWCGICLFGGGVPYHTGDKCFLVREQYSFDRAQREEVMTAIEACDKSALDKIEESDIASISAICYHSPRSKYCAMQAFTYQEFVYKAITNVKIIK
uniref:hypothetical protein n=1 Tax=Alistipes sp. TaxID=1872444 RepID=UPI0040566618